MLRETGRAAVAEFLGTFVLILSGTAVVAQVVLSGGSHGTYLSINIGWGLAVTMAVYVAGGVSGGDPNPPPTPALAGCGRVPRGKETAPLGAPTPGALSPPPRTLPLSPQPPSPPHTPHP